MKKTFLFAAFAAFTLLVSSCGDAAAEAKRLADSATAVAARDSAAAVANAAAAAATAAAEAQVLADTAAAVKAREEAAAAASVKKPGKKPKVEPVVPTKTTPTPKVGGRRPGQL